MLLSGGPKPSNMAVKIRIESLRVTMREMFFESSPMKLEKKEGEEEERTSVVNVDYSVNKVHGKQILGFATLKLRPGPVSLKIILEGRFFLADSISEEKARQEDVQKELLSAMMPFFSEIVAYLTRIAGFSPLILPPTVGLLSSRGQIEDSVKRS